MWRRAAAFGFALVMISAPCVASDLEEEIIAEMNRARSQPAAYARELRAYWAKATFNGKVYTLPGVNIRFVTQEGRPAVDEAIAFVERQAPVPALRRSLSHAQAASDLVAAQGPSGALGHFGPDGSSPAERVKRRGGDIRRTGEVIYYGHGALNSAAEVVRALIIDDGVPDRGHRWNIFDPNFRAAGAGCGPHKLYKGMCVVDFGAN